MIAINQVGYHTETDSQTTLVLQCPNCNQPNSLNGQISSGNQYTGNCDECGQEVSIQIKVLYSN